MSNIWFLRTDKDDGEFPDVSTNNPFIYSLHGICGNSEIILRHKNKLFPSLSLNEAELRKLIFKIKKELITEGLIDPNQDSKKKCDLAIRYWLSTMEIGDIVFVRNRINQVFICKITGYISEDFFDTNNCFQRPVKIIGFLKNEPPFEKIWNRTRGRKTIERNADTKIKHLVNHLLSYY